MVFVLPESEGALEKEWPTEIALWLPLFRIRFPSCAHDADAYIISHRNSGIGLVTDFEYRAMDGTAANMVEHNVADEFVINCTAGAGQ